MRLTGVMLATVSGMLLSAAGAGAQERLMTQVDAAEELAQRTGRPILALAGSAN